MSFALHRPVALVPLLDERVRPVDLGGGVGARVLRNKHVVLEVDRYEGFDRTEGAELLECRAAERMRGDEKDRSVGELHGGASAANREKSSASKWGAEGGDLSTRDRADDQRGVFRCGSDEGRVHFTR